MAAKCRLHTKISQFLLTWLLLGTPLPKVLHLYSSTLAEQGPNPPGHVDKSKESNNQDMKYRVTRAIKNHSFLAPKNNTGTVLNFPLPKKIVRQGAPYSVAPLFQRMSQCSRQDQQNQK